MFITIFQYFYLRLFICNKIGAWDNKYFIFIDNIKLIESSQSDEQKDTGQGKMYFIQFW